MIKLILGLVSFGGLTLGALYVYTGFERGDRQPGSCCHGSAAAPVEVSSCCEKPVEISSCCALPSRSTSLSKATCCEAADKGVEVLTVAPREVAGK